MTDTQAGPSLAELGHQLGQHVNLPSQPHATMSDLSLDEILLLHSMGLEPAGVVFGVQSISIVRSVWNWSQGPIGDARAAYHESFNSAKEGLRQDAHGLGALGVVGTEVEVHYTPHWITVTLTGTAVRAVGGHRQSGTPFVTNLSARDAVVLGQAGWQLLDLVAGASFVHAPRRGIGAAIGQSTQNVELTNFTETLYQARETAMEDLQQGIQGCGGSGLVDVKIADGPMHFAHHAIRFVAWGTAIRLTADAHQHLHPAVVLRLDDAVSDFEATSLNG